MGQTLSIEPKYVQLYSKTGFQGMVHEISDPVSIPQVALKGIPDNDISSLMVPSGYEVRLYADNDFNGDYRVYRGPAQVPQLKNANFDDVTSSLIVVKLVSDDADPEKDQAVLTYSGRNGTESVLVTTPLNISNVTRFGMTNNSMSKVKLASETALSVYSNKDYQGENEKFTGQYSGSLGGLTNKVSSFTLTTPIEKKFQITPATIQQSFVSNWGFWLAILIVGVLLLWLFWGGKWE